MSDNYYVELIIDWLGLVYNDIDLITYRQN